MATQQFDAIVCGSGMTGGWAAKELTERGLKVLVVERGPHLEHRTGYKTEFTPPWELEYRGYVDPELLKNGKRIQNVGRGFNAWIQDLFVDDDVDVYESPPESGFQWVRSYQLGGRSLVWGRHAYRMSQIHYSANAQDGHGVAWPVGYADIAPWYDHVERFIGVNGTVDNLATLPDGQYQPSMGLNAGEQRIADLLKANYPNRRLLPGRTANLTQPIGDRAPCQYRNQCARGCSFGAYFSSLSSTLPAAKSTGNLTVLTDSLVDSLEFDAGTRRVTGVRLIDMQTRGRSVATARVVLLCTGSFNSVALLQRSASDAAPGGLGNSSGLLGKYITDHAQGAGASASIAGIDDKMYLGRKPHGLTIPRFVNLEDKEPTDFIRGYSYQGACARRGWDRGGSMAGVGAEFKHGLRHPGEWVINLNSSIECIPRKENHVSVDFNKRDRYGLPITRIDLRWGENEQRAAVHAQKEAEAMLSLAGGRILTRSSRMNPPGAAIHEMGGACMGNDPRQSVTNSWNQLHDAPNVFVTDGAFMNSAGDRNPSLTYMAFTVRAVAHAVDLLKEGTLA